MSLKHIMLGVLSEPHSGYDIKKEFEQTLRNFWRAELSQIYPLLQKMQSEGLVSSKEDPSAIGPTRRVYKRTAKGRKELTAWLSSGPKVGTERIGYLAQVYFLSELKTDVAAIAYMQQLREYMAHWLESLELAEQCWSANDPGYPNALADEDFYPHLTLKLGLAKVRANLQWCEESIDLIKARRSRQKSA